METYYSNQASQSMPHFAGHYRQRASGFGALAAASGLPRSKVVQYLQSKAPYTEYRQFRKTFPRLNLLHTD